MLSLKPQYVSYEKKSVDTCFGKTTTLVSLKPIKDVQKTKKYFENTLSEYEFYVKDKNNIFAKRKDLDIHFKISLGIFLEIFSRGYVENKKFFIYFFKGKAFLGQNLHEDSQKYSDWYISGKKNFDALVNGGYYVHKDGYVINYLYGVNPSIPYISPTEKYDENKYKDIFKNSKPSNYSEEDLVCFTGRINPDYEQEILNYNKRNRYISHIELLDKPQAILCYHHQYYIDDDGNIYRFTRSDSCCIYHKLVLDSGKVLYLPEFTRDFDDVLSKVKNKKTYYGIKETYSYIW